MVEPAPAIMWTQCPKKGCDAPPEFWGAATKILIEDPHIPARYVIVHGWVCEGLIYGSVVRAGGKNLNPPSHGHTYLVDLPDRVATVS